MVNMPTPLLNPVLTLPDGSAVAVRSIAAVAVFDSTVRVFIGHPITLDYGYDSFAGAVRARDSIIAEWKELA